MKTLILSLILTLGLCTQVLAQCTLRSTSVSTSVTGARVLTAVQACEAGEEIRSGGCEIDTDEDAMEEIPINHYQANTPAPSGTKNAWKCRIDVGLIEDTDTKLTAYAICCI